MLYYGADEDIYNGYLQHEMDLRPSIKSARKAIKTAAGEQTL